METVSHYVEVNAPAEQAYSWWRGLTNLPTIMPDVRSVEPRGGTELTHWKVAGPLGKTIEWDAQITEDVPNQKISWTSVRQDDNDVETSGSVRFESIGGDSTGVEVQLTYSTPGGAVGQAVASLFSDPQAKVERALDAFKEAIEGRSAGQTAGTASG